MTERLLLNRAELRRCGIKLDNSTLLRLESAGTFPARVRIGKSVFWRSKEIEEYIEQLGNRRRAGK